jgi:hypothetical protein
MRRKIDSPGWWGLADWGVGVAAILSYIHSSSFTFSFSLSSSHLSLLGPPTLRSLRPFALSRSRYVYSFASLSLLPLSV